jgi:predicted nucleotidyltransferase
MYRRVNITVPESVLRRADEYADANRYTRSGLISSALEDFIRKGGGEAGDSASIARETYAAYATAAPCLDHITPLLRAFLSARDDVEAAWVFGSVARRTAGAHSDVDLAVLPRGRVTSEQSWDLKIDLMSRLPGALQVAEVDVVVVPQMGAVLGHRALIGGVRVFGEGSTRASEAELDAMRRYVDFGPVLRMLDRNLSERLMRDVQS